MSKQITLGITAHVDSGKTTLSEAILYLSGEIRSPGRVDDGNSFLDTHRMEKQRGITVFAHRAEIERGDKLFTLLDTPGHVDFSAETERTFSVLDYAVMVISGSEGVQSHTETLWELLGRYGVPVFIFVNKMDMNGTDGSVILAQLKNRLSDGIIDFTDSCCEEFYENCAMQCDRAAEEYFENGKISDESIILSVRERKIFPCLFGSALKMQGIEEFLCALERFTDEPERETEFGARVYKISEDDKGRRLTNIKITGGCVNVRDSIEYVNVMGETVTEKISEIRFYSGGKYRSSDTAPTGSVCALLGFSQTYSGQGIGVEKSSFTPVLEPVMTYSLELPEGADVYKMLENLRRLEEEDPALNVLWNEQLRKIHVRLMGEVQLEILSEIIKERFGETVMFGQGTVTYKETIEDTVEGVGHYEPLRHYAEVHLILEPLERGSGLVFDTLCKEDDLDRNWQSLILTHLEEKMHLGVLTGSPITDMKITLAAGKAHLKHTEGGDFRQATYRAVRQGLRKAKSVLLEPYYSFRLEIPTECAGRAMTDIQQMNGELEPVETDGEFTFLRGTCPAGEMGNYQQEVTGYTRGRGRLFCSFAGYDRCRNETAVIAEIGYNCDKDITNTADSVFCSHGAGFNVRWDRTEEYMHLPAVLKKVGQEEERILSYHRAESYVGRAAEDRELMEIFERTYGAVKRDPVKAFKSVKKPVAYKGKKPVVPTGPEYLLVDGYNIIFAWDELKAIAKDNLDAARSQLINKLCNYQGYRLCELILVFDAYKVKGTHREVEKFGNISVVYTKEHETADTFIEKAVHKLCRNNKVRVATSDGMEQVIILGNGALRVSAEEFHEEVQAAENAIREYIEELNGRKL